MEQTEMTMVGLLEILANRGRLYVPVRSAPAEAPAHDTAGAPKRFPPTLQPLGMAGRGGVCYGRTASV